MHKEDRTRKILIAAGGTGGHLFPAQALADGLLCKEEKIEVLFAGKGLESNRYFHRDRYSFRDIASATPFSGKRFAIFHSMWGILRGVGQAMGLLKEFQPEIVVGFGSYHTFPLLTAAFLMRIPIALFEPNSIPGKVNRLFSRIAALSAVQFAEAARHMSGPIVEVSIPLWQNGEYHHIKLEEARRYFGLDPNVATVLVFGGSQGASSINRIVSSALENRKGNEKIQVIHITGNGAETATLQSFYRTIAVPACVKDFEIKMSYAWKAADCAICRAGAATLGELIAFEVPAILIPFPRAADDHQTTNAKFFEEDVGGGIRLPETELNATNLSSALDQLLDSGKREIEGRRQAIRDFKMKKDKKDLCSLVCGLLT